MKKVYWRALSIVWIVPLSLMTLSFHSCGQKAGEEAGEALIEAATGDEIEIDKGGDKVVIESNGVKTEMKMGEHSWPSDMPGDVPKFEEGKIQRTTSSDSPDLKAWGVYFEGVNTPSLDAYEKELKSAGFKTAIFKMGDNGNVTGEKEKLVVSATQGEEGLFVISVQQMKN